MKKFRKANKVKKANKKGNIYRSAAQVTVFSTFEKATSFVYRIILSRTIGAAGLGIYQICLSVFAVFLTAASSGIPVTVSRLMAKNSVTGNPRAKHAVVTSGVLCTLLFTVPVAVILFFARDMYSFLFPDRECVDIFVWLLPGLILTSIYAVMRGSFWGNKQFLPYSVIELAENSVMVIAGCILVHFAKDSVGGARAAIIAVLISYIFSFAVSVFWYLFRGGRFVRPKGEFKSLFKASMPVTVMRTSTSLLNSCVAMFLPALLTAACGYTQTEALTLYGIVLGMSVPVLFIPSSLIGSIAVVVAPEMSENFYAKRTELLKRDVEKTLNASVLIACLIIPVLFTLGTDIGVLLYANSFSGVTIRIFSFMLLPMCISMITTTILNSMHHEVRTLIYFFIGALAMLGCIFAFTKLLGIYAYMVGLTASFIITAAFNLHLLKKNCPNINYFGFLAKSVVLCALGCLFGGLLSNLLSSIAPVFKILICGVVVGGFQLAAFYAMSMLSTRPVKKLFSRS